MPPKLVSLSDRGSPYLPTAAPCPLPMLLLLRKTAHEEGLVDRAEGGLVDNAHHETGEVEVLHNTVVGGLVLGTEEEEQPLLAVDIAEELAVDDRMEERRLELHKAVGQPDFVVADVALGEGLVVPGYSIAQTISWPPPNLHSLADACRLMSGVKSVLPV